MCRSIFKYEFNIDFVKPRKGGIDQMWKIQKPAKDLCAHPTQIDWVHCKGETCPVTGPQATFWELSYVSSISWLCNIQHSSLRTQNMALTNSRPRQSFEEHRYFLFMVGMLIYRRWWVHGILQKRHEHGAYYHLVKNLQLHEEQFQRYFSQEIAGNPIRL